MELTLEQKISSSFDRNLSVTANAGSGKTKVLVDRFIDILTDSERLNKLNCEISICKDPAEIVAITFTKKAASEMKEKINRVLDEKIIESNYSNKHLISIRNRMIYANVSTIHSFCNKLLKEYPLEADVVPNFGELSELEGTDLINDKIKEFIGKKTTLQNTSEFVEDRNLERMIFFFSKKKLISFLTYLLSDFYELYRLKEFYDLNQDKLISNIKEQFFNEYSAKLYNKNADLDFVFDYYFNNNISDNARNELNISFNHYKNYREINIVDFDTLFESINHLSQIKSSKFFTNDYKISGTYIKSPKFIVYNDKMEGVANIVEILNVLKNSDLDNKLIEYARVLVDYAVEISKTIEDEKNRISKYNFDDLMLRALKILNNENAVNDIRSKIKYLMIDEFQDTNGLQYELVKKLITVLENPTTESKINLFIVGDAKQSIYGFRKADVRVFSQAMKDILESNISKSRGIFKPFISKFGTFDISENELSFGNSKLTTTFRLQPVIGAFINDLFEILMKKNESEYSIAYEKFVIGRNPNADNANELGTVNFLFHKDEKLVESNNENEDNYEVDNSSPISVSESRMVASKLLEIVNSEESSNRYLIQDGDNYRKALFSDIFILARKRSDLETLAEELRAYKIPYIFHSGAGFYNTTEIKDLISYLNLIINKDNDIALLSVLKSNFFEFSDNEIFILKYFKAEKSYFDKLEKLVFEIKKGKIDLTGIDKEKIFDAYDFLNESIKLAPSQSVQAIIRKLIEKTFYLAKLSDSNRFEQIHANIEKMIEESREFERQGFKTMYDFVCELNYNLDNSAQNAEAVILNGENAVNLMTIHASKGLDAPIVFVISANSKTKSNLPEIFKSDKYGILFNLPDTDSDENKFETTPMKYLGNLEENAKQSYEELRLFYVALTRAKDHLFISSSVTFKKDGNAIANLGGFLGLLVDNFEPAFGMGLSEIIEGKTALFIEKNTSLDMYSGGNEFQINDFKYKVFFEHELNQNVEQNEIIKESIITEPKFIFDKIDFIFSEENISPTKLHDIIDRNSFIEKYVYDLDPKRFELTFSSQNTNPELNKYNAMAKGTTIHSLFENISKWYEPNNIDKNKIKIALEELEYFSEINPDWYDEIINQVYATASTIFFRENANDLTKWRQELSFRIPYKNDFLKGVIDLIIERENGEFDIWDWKSNFIKDNEHFLKTVKDYELQMKFYCFILSKLYQNQQFFKARLIFTKLAKPTSKESEFTYEFNWTKNELLNFENEIQDTIQVIKSLYL